MPQPQSGQDKPGRSKVEYPTPDNRDTILSDTLTGNLADYLSLVAGTQHTDWVNNPDHRLLREIPVDWQTVQRVYGKDRIGEQLYNAEITYAEDSKDHPVFVRDFLVRRHGYTPATPGTKLSGLVRGTVTAAGSGYTQATVGATLSGGVGSGGAVTPIVSNTGTIIGLQITAIGHYTIPPAVTITDSGTGSGSTGEVFIQPKPSLLVAQQIIRMAESPLDSLYFLSRRTYMTLPGPWIPFTRYDDDLGPIQGRRRTVLAGTYAGGSFTPDPDLVPALTATSKTTYEARDGNQNISWQIEENYSSGAGTGSNPAFPIGRTDFYDDERGAVHQVRQISSNLSAVGSQAVSGGTVTEIRYDPYNEFLRRKITETWAIPGPTRTEYGFNERFGIPTIRRKTKVAFSGLSLPAIGSTITGDYRVTGRAYLPDSEFLGTKVVDGMDGNASTLSGMTRKEALNGSEPMPSTLEILIGSWTYDDACRFQPPFAGVHYQLTHHVPSSPIYCEYSYTFGKNTGSPIEGISLWTVTSNESRLLPISRNTLHDDYTAAETGACSHDIEVMPESVPPRTAYVTGDEYVFNVTEEPVAGNELGLWERRTFSFIAT